MILFDVNVLVNARVARHEHHSVAVELLERVVNAAEPYAVSEYVLSSYVRIVTQPSLLTPADTAEQALAFCDRLRDRANARIVAPGAGHWVIFAGLCRATEARGGIVPDAYYAALAIEHNCEWISFDRDFARFKGLRWRSPLD